MSKKILVLIIISFALTIIMPIKDAYSENNYLDTERVSLNENPERGFYRTCSLYLKESGNKPINPKSSTSNLLYLMVDLSTFSKAQNKINDIPLTDDVLNALSLTLENIKNNNNSVILRFVYDKNSDGIKDDEGMLSENGKRYVEPSIDMIINHIKSLKDIFYKYDSTIYLIEMGFFGDYGELHGSSMCTEDNFNKALDALLDSTPENVNISVRTPSQILSYAEYKGDTNLDIQNINKFVTDKSMKSYRIGIYDDGYLGSNSDLGTYKDRNIELDFLKSQTLHTAFGGEAVINVDNTITLDGTKYMNKYSDVSNLENEALETHTDFLNYEWNNKLHNEWKNRKYNGNNAYLKSLENYTEYDFINEHLGYRYLLNNYNIENINNNLNIDLEIANTGFSNIKKNKNIEILITDLYNNIIYDYNLNYDIKNILGNDIDNIKFNINPKIDDGNYKMFIRLSSGILNNGRMYLPVKFANKDIWNDELEANYIGKFNYKREVKSNSKSNNENISNNTNTNYNNNYTNKESNENRVNKEKSSNNTSTNNVATNDSSYKDTLVESYDTTSTYDKEDYNNVKSFNEKNNITKEKESKVNKIIYFVISSILLFGIGVILYVYRKFWEV